MNRPCLDCGTPSPRTRCTPCTRAKDRGRGTRQQRGYDADHMAARAALDTMLPLPCLYCERPITPDIRWVAAHVVDGDPSHGWGAAHPICNEQAKRRPGVV